MVIKTIWLVTLLAVLGLWVWRDSERYRRFKLIQDSGERRRFFWRWTAENLVLLGGGGLATLWLCGVPLDLHALPAEFAPVADALKNGDAPPRTGDGAVGMIIGVAIGGAIAIGVQMYRVRRLLTPVLGDIEPLLPRNGRERMAVVPLAFNAGISEELFFRLALPVLLFQVGGSLWLALVGSTVIFGLVHAYQGWTGVLATGFVGGVLMVLYLSSGSLLKVMALHVVIDLVAFLVRPAITARLERRRERAANA